MLVSFQLIQIIDTDKILNFSDNKKKDVVVTNQKFAGKFIIGENYIIFNVLIKYFY